MTDKEKFVFIVGVGRSGTSLLHSMLNAHTQVCFPPEINFIRRFLATRELEETLKRGGIGAVVDLLEGDDHVSRLGLAPEEVSRAIQEMGAEFSAAGLYQRFLRLYADKRGGAIWVGDKDPRTVEYLVTLKRHFPDAVILHIVRDPRDVLVSKKKAAWSRDHPSIYHIFANRVQLKLGREQGRDLFKERYFELSYRDLLLRPEEILHHICELMEIDYEPGMMDFIESSKELVAEEEMQWKKETLGPLLGANRGKWLRELSEWEILLTELTCREALDLIGYKLGCRVSRANSIQRFGIHALSWLLISLDPLYRLYRGWRISA
jgi:hypothetical protein